MAVLYFVGILLIAVNAIGQQTNFNCLKRPAFTSDIKNCCKRPTISNLDKYKSLCSTAKPSGRFAFKSDNKQSFMDPCIVDCIYTQAGVLNNNAFNMVKMNAFLNQIMPNDPDMVKLFSVGFQTCGPDTANKMQDFEANQSLIKSKVKQYPGPACSPFASLATFCAMRYTFVNCPDNLWTNSDTCNKAREYLQNCDPMQFGGSTNSGQQVAAQRAPTQTAAVQKAPTQTATLQTAAVQTDTVQKAPAQTATVQKAPTQTATLQTAAVQTDTVQRAPAQTATVQKVPAQTTTLQRAAV